MARHAASTPGNPRIADEHYPQRSEPGQRAPQPTSAEEAAFLALGEGATQWLVEAAAAGARRIHSPTHP